MAGGPALPQLGAAVFLTDTGLETELIFRAGWVLPHFAALPLVASARGEAWLTDYYRRHLEIARAFGAWTGRRPRRRPRATTETRSPRWPLLGSTWCTPPRCLRRRKRSGWCGRRPRSTYPSR